MIIYYLKFTFISLTVSNGEAIWFDRFLLLFFKQKVVPAITQPPFGVGASSLDTMCFSIRSCAFRGVVNFWLRMTDFGVKTMFLKLKLSPGHNSAPCGVGTSSLDTMCFSIRSCALWGFLIRMTDLGQKTTFLNLKLCPTLGVKTMFFALKLC